jgi:hypothetical protein
MMDGGLMNSIVGRVAVLAGTLLVLPGCGGATTVSGTVTYEGEPIQEGWVTFLPADGAGSEAGAKITDGQYHVEAIAPGEKTVQIVGVKEVPFVASSEEMEQQSRENPRLAGGRDLVYPADTVPPDAEGNNQRVTVKDGTQTLNFQLKKPADAP